MPVMLQCNRFTHSTQCLLDTWLVNSLWGIWNYLNYYHNLRILQSRTEQFLSDNTSTVLPFLYSSHVKFCSTSEKNDILCWHSLLNFMKMSSSSHGEKCIIHRIRKIEGVSGSEINIAECTKKLLTHRKLINLYP